MSAPSDTSRCTRHDGNAARLRIARDDIAATAEFAASVPSAAIDGTTGPPDWRAERIREWLLLLLRFAVTWDRRDKMAALGVADELDALGLRWRPSAPRFFCRTTRDVCHAIVAIDDPKRTAILRKHLERIDDPRLQRAFRAAASE
jgi:hypothetical protein